MGKPIIMGRKTWESLGRPLPGRSNIVITRNQAYKAEGATVVYSLDEALRAAGAAEEAMIIGGANLYAQALPRAQRLYLTRVEGEYKGDAWFPEFDESQWQIESKECHKADGRNDSDYCFITLSAA